MHDLRALKKKKNKMDNELIVMSDKVSDLQRKLSLKKNELEFLSKQISEIENPRSIRISEHAIVRYFERILGVDIEGLRKMILNDQSINYVRSFNGTGKFRNAELGCQIWVNDYVVTTIT